MSTGLFNHRAQCWAATTLLVAVALGAGQIGWAQSGTADELIQRTALPKPPATIVDPRVHHTDIIIVKFQDDLMIRERDGELTDFGTGALSGAQDLLAELLDARWERSQRVPEEGIDELRAIAEGNTGKVMPDLNVIFRVYLSAGTDAGATIDAFNTLDIVELAAPVYLPVPPPTPPDMLAEQVYLNRAPDSLNSRRLWAFPGGTGAGVAVCDIEYSWNASHQDLTPVTLVGPDPTDPFDDTNHGTAVIGIIGAFHDGVGTSGMARASVKFFAAANTGGVKDVAAAIMEAAAVLVPGDVILIEQQAAGPLWEPGSQFGYVPQEWDLFDYLAITIATGANVIVVEAAGNGSQNLDDDDTYGDWFSPDNDSGAIMVGAGAAAVPLGSDVPRSRLDFSNYGATLDVQGWGQAVTTTGYGDRYNAEGQDLWYTAGFGGTSSGSALVAAACVQLQAAYQAQTGARLTPTEMRDILRATGSPQQNGVHPVTENIGPLPNLLAALALAVNNQPPVALCQVAAKSADDDCCITVNVSDIDGGSFDPDDDNVPAPRICITAVDGVPAGDPNDPNDCVESVEICDDGTLDPHAVTLTITDAFDASDSCNAEVLVVDDTLPEITCSATGGAVDENCEFLVTFEGSITDNCCVDDDDVDVVVTLPTGNATLGTPSINVSQVNVTEVSVTGSVLVSDLTSCPATVRVAIDATDCAGNMAEAPCVATADVVDEIDPVLTCPPDAFFEHGNFFCNDGEVLDWLESATATDNCDTDVDIVHDAPACGFPPDSTTLVTWTATDDCGNTDECSATVTIPPLDRGQPAIKGSLLIYPNVELRWDAGGNLIQDTFISLNNDFGEDVQILAYYVSETCSSRNNAFTLTHNEPASWSAATGLPKGLSPWTVVASPYLDPEGSGEFILRGYIALWAINLDHKEIRWNHLHGQATIVNYADNSAWEYLAWAFPTDCVAHEEQLLDCLDFDPNGACCAADVVPGNLDFDGFQYDITPGRLMFNFTASGSGAFSVTGHAVTHDTDLTLHIMNQDLRQETTGPCSTKAKFDIWNENEISFSGVDYCVVKWDQSLLSRVGGHFLRENLQTDAGRARIEGLASGSCPESIDAALIGVANRVLELDGTRAQSGSSLWLTGYEAAHLQVDIPAPPEEKSMPTLEGSGTQLGPYDELEAAQEP